MKQLLLRITLLSFVMIPSMGRTQTDWKTLENELYSIEYPADWILSQNNQSFAVVDNPDRPSFIVTFDYVQAKGDPIEELVKEMLIHSGLDQPVILINEQIKHRDNEFTHLVFVEKSGDGPQQLIVDNLFTVHKDHNVMLTFIYKNVDAKDFEKMVRKISDSLKLN